MFRGFALVVSIVASVFVISLGYFINVRLDAWLERRRIQHARSITEEFSNIDTEVV